MVIFIQESQHDTEMGDDIAAEPAYDNALSVAAAPIVDLPITSDGTISIPRVASDAIFNIPMLAEQPTPAHSKEGIVVLPNCTFSGCTINLNMMAKNN